MCGSLIPATMAPPGGQTHVAGPTDLRTAPLPERNYVGEYQGLAALRGSGRRPGLIT